MNGQDVDAESQSEKQDLTDPGISSVFRFLTYGASLPERALRSTSAMIGGALRESTELLVPQAFRNSKSYNIFVTQMLDIVIENVGGVKKADDSEEKELQEFVARKAVGNFVELAGIATLHLSPMTILAVVSDIAYGSKAYLHELSDELKREGIIDQESTIDNAADLLSSISEASGVTASAFDMPPLSVSGLKETIAQTRDAVSKVNPINIIPQSEVDRLWSDMRELAEKEETTLFEISSTMTMYSLKGITNVGKGALSTIKVAGNLFDKHIFEHYWNSIEEITDKGMYATLAESSKPYLDAVWTNFSSVKPTLTEDILNGKLIGRAWSGFRGWFNGENDEPLSTDADDDQETAE